MFHMETVSPGDCRYIRPAKISVLTRGILPIPTIKYFIMAAGENFLLVASSSSTGLRDALLRKFFREPQVHPSINSQEFQLVNNSALIAIVHRSTLLRTRRPRPIVISITIKTSS